MFGNKLPAAVARLKVIAELDQVFSVQRPQGVRRRQTLKLFVIHFRSLLKPVKASRSLAIPSRMRVFTVPSGSLRRAAIWL